VFFGCAVVLFCTLYAGWHLDRGWIPHDEGQLGHTAERILAGELPHANFIEPYTGGLGYLNALAFRVAGVRSEVLRWQMLPFFALFVGCVFYMAQRVVSPAAAAGVTLLAGCLTVPIYPAGMPSWYNLFAATYGTAALLRFLDTARTRWLVLAGVCGGLSILVKITGLYFVAAALLALAYREQVLCHAADRRSLTFSSLASVALTACGGLSLFFVRRENPLMDLVHFCLPFAGLTTVVICHEWKRGRGELLSRVTSTARYLIPFGVGIAIPVVVLLVPYLVAGATSDLLQGLFVLPARRLVGARMPLPDPRWLPFAIPLAILFSAGLWSRSLTSTRKCVACGAVLIALFAVSHTDRGHLAIFQAIRHQIPLLVTIALAMVLGAGGESLSDRRRQELLLLASMAFFVSLIQFPYSGGFYFFYAAPMSVLLGCYVVAFQPRAPRRLHALVLGSVVAFLMLRMHHPSPAITGGPYAPRTEMERLELDRCRLLVRADQARLYNSVIAAVQSHSRDGDYIYAAPDCPEVYFLAGRRNPTRSLYDLFNSQDAVDCYRLIEDLDRLNVKVVVLKKCSEFSPPLAPGLVSMIEQRFRHRQHFPANGGAASRDAFVVLWRS
jgi:hypothetical protein